MAINKRYYFGKNFKSWKNEQTRRHKRTLTKKIEKKTLQSIEQSEQSQPVNIGPRRVSGTFSEHSLKILFYHPRDVPVWHSGDSLIWHSKDVPNQPPRNVFWYMCSGHSRSKGGRLRVLFWGRLLGVPKFRFTFSPKFRFT